MSEKLEENPGELDVRQLFERIALAENLTGDRWLNDEYCEELESFSHDPEFVERTDDGELRATFDLDSELWFHEEGGVDVHIGIENTVDEFDGRSTKIDGELHVWFDVDDDGKITEAEGEIELFGCPDVCQVYHTSPDEFHEGPYDVER